MNQINTPKKLEDCKLIRKLSFLESVFDNEFMNGNTSQTRVFITSVNKKYRINIDVLKQALNIWIKIHPLLQATVFRDIDPITQKPKLGLPRYFVYMDKIIDDYKNVELLEETSDIKWTDLIESELKTSLDYIHGPLWRLKVFKFKESDESFDKFAFIFTTTHSISDGRNGYSIGVQFLNILIDTLDNKLIENIFQIHTEFSCDQKVEEFCKKSEILITEQDNDFDMLTHRLPNKVGNKNGVYGRFDYIFLESEKLTKLINKMKFKAPKAKLTALLLILLCDSFKRICLRYNVENMPLDRVQALVMVCLRNKLGIENTQMGVYSITTMTAVKFEDSKKNFQTAVAVPDFILKTILIIPKLILTYFLKNFVLKSSYLKKGLFQIARNLSSMKSTKIFKNNPTNLSECEIWSLTEIETIKMQKMLSSNAELKINPDIQDYFVDLINSDFDFSNNKAFSFCLSNIGIMNTTKDKDIIKLNEHYVAIPCLENRSGAVMQFGITTIENNLNIGICFDERKFSIEFIKDIKKDLLEKIDSICE